MLWQAFESHAERHDREEFLAMLRFHRGDDAASPPIHLATPPIDALVPAHLETATFAVG